MRCGLYQYCHHTWSIQPIFCLLLLWDGYSVISSEKDITRKWRHGAQLQIKRPAFTRVIWKGWIRDWNVPNTCISAICAQTLSIPTWVLHGGSYATLPPFWWESPLTCVALPLPPFETRPQDSKKGTAPPYSQEEGRWRTGILFQPLEGRTKSSIRFLALTAPTLTAQPLWNSFPRWKSAMSLIIWRVSSMKSSMGCVTLSNRVK